MEIQILYVLVLLGTGALVGFACGMLGVGGGFLMVPVQIWALTSSGIDPTIAVRVAFGTSLAVVLPTAIAGCRGWAEPSWEEPLRRMSLVGCYKRFSAWWFSPEP
jgi:uncharacterized membrane protein YfcA